MGRLFLAGRDRYLVNFSRLPAPQAQRGPKGAPGTPAPEPPAPLDGPDQLFHVPSDGSLWISRDEAIRHILNGPVLQNLYRRETLTVDAPKGNFTAVAVCGFSGAILGPPNHHSFQTTVARIHREQFYNLPLDRYKSRIRTEKDEALVAKWLEEQSTTTVFVPLTPQEIAEATAARAAAAADPKQAATESTPETAPENPGAAPEAAESPAAETPESSGTTAEVPAPETEATESPADAAPTEDPAPKAESTAPPNSETEAEAVADSPAETAPAIPAIPLEPLKTQGAMEAHFIEHHAPGLIKSVTRVSVSGNIPGKLLAPPLLALLRMEVEQQQRFPMQLVQDLCRDLEKENLKFFKRDKKATFVCRTRPHFIGDESHLSPRLRSIVGVVKANPGITVPKLVSVLAPHLEAPAAKAPVKTPEPAAPVAAPQAEATPEAVVETPPTPEAAAETASAPVTEDPVMEETGPGQAATETPDAAPENTQETTPEAAEISPPAPGETDAPIAPEPAGETPAIETSASEAPATPRENRPEGRQRRPKGPKAPPAPPAPPAPLTMEEIGVLQDLRWLVQEGFVTEYASGELQILGRPPQPPTEKKVKEPKSAPGPKTEPGAETTTEDGTIAESGTIPEPTTPAEPGPPAESTAAAETLESATPSESAESAAPSEKPEA